MLWATYGARSLPHCCTRGNPAAPPPPPLVSSASLHVRCTIVHTAGGVCEGEQHTTGGGNSGGPSAPTLGGGAKVGLGAKARSWWRRRGLCPALALVRLNSTHFTPIGTTLRLNTLSCTGLTFPRNPSCSPSPTDSPTDSGVRPTPAARTRKFTGVAERCKDCSLRVAPCGWAIVIGFALGFWARTCDEGVVGAGGAVPE